jgi:hypothetical protein
VWRSQAIGHDKRRSVDRRSQVERTGDLGEGNAGILSSSITVNAHAPWIEVEQVDLDRPPSGQR